MEATLPDSTTNEFVYDGDKRRVSRKDAGGEEKWFLYDGINILQDLATDGTVWTSYVQGIGIDKLISVTEWAGQTSPDKRYYHSDAIGSVRSLTDEDENQVGTYEYDAWGKVTSETGSSTNEYKFTSRRWEQDLGLQYNRARFYDPETGRFITPDPLTGGPDDPSISYFSGVYSAFHRFIKEHVDALQPDKHNRYVYCYNNPVNLVDPLGLENFRERVEERRAAWEAWEEARLYELDESTIEALAETFAEDKQDVAEVKIYENTDPLGMVPEGGAMTFGDSTIYVESSAEDFFNNPIDGAHNTVHEFAHIFNQWREKIDVGFVIEYLVESAVQAITGNDPHGDNKYEQEAIGFADKKVGEFGAIREEIRAEKRRKESQSELKIGAEPPESEGPERNEGAQIEAE